MDLLLISVEPHLIERAGTLALVGIVGAVLIRRWPLCVWVVAPCLGWSSWFVIRGVAELMPSMANATTRPFIVPQFAISALATLIALGLPWVAWRRSMRQRSVD
ncbi:MAG TPA: hypothetical protein VIP11_05775 [Gemmatimonadaceae bacterium]